jgi:hypothetical protein
MRAAGTAPDCPRRTEQRPGQSRIDAMGESVRYTRGPSTLAALATHDAGRHAAGNAPLGLHGRPNSAAAGSAGGAGRAFGVERRARGTSRRGAGAADGDDDPAHGVPAPGTVTCSGAGGCWVRGPLGPGRCRSPAARRAGCSRTAAFGFPAPPLARRPRAAGLRRRFGPDAALSRPAVACPPTGTPVAGGSRGGAPRSLGHAATTNAKATSAASRATLPHRILRHTLSGPIIGC